MLPKQRAASFSSRGRKSFDERTMTSREIRQQFIEFFKGKGHAFVPSSPVVPHDDPTLMFTNAGMNQFKPYFLGTETPAVRRAANTQKCIRAGGKHNDLDDVGQDTYHHTFFEMLGNWSFGDYFKKEAIDWAWELMTGLWKIDPTRLHATYFEGDATEGLDPDHEARDLWLQHLPPERVHPGNKKDNFWEMGDTGPCGPCSEIHIDLTPDKSGAKLVNAGDARAIELWNLVFIQFNRSPDGTLTPLPSQHVDTGMGFERICSVLQGMQHDRLCQFSNYDTDVFTTLFAAIQKRCSAIDYKRTLPGDDAPDAQIKSDVTYRVIADHLRCLTFAITDGAMPSNEGRGYVLRRILRRAVRYGRQYFDMHEPFLCDLVPSVVEQMGDFFPELKTGPNPQHTRDNVQYVAEILRDEEASFLKTLDRGIKLFNDAAKYAETHHHGRISGEDAFKLHDTYGFPIDLTELMAEERGMKVDIGEYERLMDEAREKARGITRNLDDAFDEDTYRNLTGGKTCDDSLKYVAPFECGAFLHSIGARMVKLFDSDSAKEGEHVTVGTNRTPFYAEQGGQVSDTGVLETEKGDIVDIYAVEKRGQQILHRGTVRRGTINSGLEVRMRVDRARRDKITFNHTSTHILNLALRNLLGDHVQQKGSLVDPEKTRFDFSHNKPVTADELARIEALCAEQIATSQTVYTKEVEQSAAREINTLRAVFGEKYPDRVRVVSVGADIDEILKDPKNDEWMKYSVEFCGGTHVANTRDIGDFVLTSEEAVAKGVRRLVGITGDAARDARRLGYEFLAEACGLAGRTPPSPPFARGGENQEPPTAEEDGTRASTGETDQSRDPESDQCGSTKEAEQGTGANLATKLADLQSRLTEAVIPVTVRNDIREVVTEIQKTLKELNKQAAGASADAVLDTSAKLLEQAETVGGVKVIVGEVPSAKADALRGAIDWFRQKADSTAVVLACRDDEGKVTLLAGMSKDVNKMGVKAGDVIKEIAPLVGGRGGGRPDMAQGGGTNADGIETALQRAAEWIKEKIGG